MSQEYFSAGGSSSSGRDGSSNRQDRDENPPPVPESWTTPQYMTVGNGSASAAAEALIASLNQDSGYGGSIAGDSAMDHGDLTDWRAGLLEDRPTPDHTPALSSAAGIEGKSDSVMSSKNNTLI